MQGCGYNNAVHMDLWKLATPVCLTACLWTVEGNPHRHGENLQSPHRVDTGPPAGEWNPGPSFCDMTALSTVLPGLL